MFLSDGGTPERELEILKKLIECIKNDIEKENEGFDDDNA